MGWWEAWLLALPCLGLWLVMVVVMVMVMLRQRRSGWLEGWRKDDRLWNDSSFQVKEEEEVGQGKGRQYSMSCT